MESIQWAIGYTFVIGYMRELKILEDFYPRNVTKETERWQPPTNRWVKVNFDGRFYNDLEASSSSIIIRDNKGLIMGATCNWNRNIPSEEVTEALEVLQAVQFAQEIGFRKVKVEGDSLMIISKLRMQGMDMSEVSNYICVAKQIIMGFESFKFQYIKRGGNRVAYLLMKEGFIQKRDVRWVKVVIRESVVVEERNLCRTT
ncbi:hypothetical protein PVK06_039276 [Gossypium arboreum]|uniref:RNase H type-1 domain-containing protein n=1 Tax=Gossypium arboreum TaxID=29729 RepID=A0ABR0N2F9_GOSAR|nr:hypothetical protein PVK06_039276 [Gossypium arboreum]